MGAGNDADTLGCGRIGPVVGVAGPSLVPIEVAAGLDAAGLEPLLDDGARAPQRIIPLQNASTLRGLFDRAEAGFSNALGIPLRAD